MAEKPKVLLELPQDEAVALLNVLTNHSAAQTDLEALMRGITRLRQGIAVESGPGGDFDAAA
jgi:hypothetical protein